jgi:Mg2+ and Co2+ transporter CorA
MALKIILALVMLAVVAVLSAGVFGLATGSPPERSNKLMRWRIILQGVAIAILALIFMSRK